MPSVGPAPVALFLDSQIAIMEIKKGRMKEVFVVLSRGANRLCISPLCPYYLVAVAKWENRVACICIADDDQGKRDAAQLILLHGKKVTSSGFLIKSGPPKPRLGTHSLGYHR